MLFSTFGDTEGFKKKRSRKGAKAQEKKQERKGFFTFGEKDVHLETFKFEK